MVQGTWGNSWGKNAFAATGVEIQWFEEVARPVP